ncbi:MAG: glycine cleavage system protein GcvH [candidate division Zixibacteria bacterium]|nr:glycine cleavage system protein GcvH [candidate division Zixibacteria bacterium]
MIKDDLKYTKDHEWVRVDGDTGTVGVTDFAQGELGDVVYLELPPVGEKLVAGARFGTIEAVKTVAELYAPVSGTVTAVNARLTEEANLVNQDCYGEGWMIKVRLGDPKELGMLLSPGEYGQLIGQAGHA